MLSGQWANGGRQKVKSHWGCRVHKQYRLCNGKLLRGGQFGLGWQQRGGGGAVAWGEGIPMGAEDYLGVFWWWFLFGIGCLYVRLTLMVDWW
jgi:hypothetical protein